MGTRGIQGQDSLSYTHSTANVIKAFTDFFNLDDWNAKERLYSIINDAKGAHFDPRTNKIFCLSRDDSGFIASALGGKYAVPDYLWYKTSGEDLADFQKYFEYLKSENLLLDLLPAPTMLQP